MLVNILDLEAGTPRVRQFVDSLGDAAREWPALRMAALRGNVQVPSTVSADLPRPPTPVNRQRWAVLDGLGALLDQAHRHWDASAANGNAELAAVAGGIGRALPLVDHASGDVSASPGPPRPTRLGSMAAVNLSLGTTVPGAFQPEDPINVATSRVAESVPVVMAAGKGAGLRRGPAAYSRWAKAPWVIAVTALRDGRIAEDSATGSATVVPAVAAPDDRLTVYHATTGEIEAHRGTSIAAAVVSGELLCLAAFCLTVRTGVEEKMRSDPEGVARVGVGILDTGFDRSQLREPSWPYGSLPVAGLARQGIERVAAAWADADLPPELLVPGPDALTRLLLASARPVDGHSAREVGAGEVSPGTTAIFLSRLDAGEYLRHLLGPRPGAQRVAATAGDDRAYGRPAAGDADGMAEQRVRVAIRLPPSWPIVEPEFPAIHSRRTEVTQRAPYEPLEELPSMPRRDLRRDDRFDVIETFELTRAPAAAPVNPRIVSSAHGPIRHLMLWYSEETEENKPYRTVFSDLMRLLPSETRITMVVHPSSAADAEALAAERAGEVEIVTAPDWLAFTVWAEDACVVVEDASADPPITYLVEPFAFPRVGDEVVADLVAQATSLQSTQLPLIFQGGNVLIGDDFVLIGRDYLDQSIRSHFENGQLRGFPETAPRSEQQAWVRDLFRRTFDPERELHFLESDPTGRPGNALFEHQGQVWLDHVDAGWGDRQPIFHIDMFVSLAGRDQRTGRYRVLVGDPTVANEMLGWQPEPHDLAGEFDAIAAQLEALDFDVRRTPLVHTFAPELRPGAVTTPEGETAEFVARRRWYHATANNCLVQIDGDRHDVWVPTYGHEPRENLTPVDARHKAIWEGLGFTVHQLGDFHQFAFNQGALHCIKKYLSR